MNEIEKVGLEKIFDSFETIMLIAHDSQEMFKTLRHGKSDEWLSEKEKMINDTLILMRSIEMTATEIMKKVKQEMQDEKR